jgi:hypothetical protein
LKLIFSVGLDSASHTVGVACDDMTDSSWTVPATVIDSTISVDYSSKGGASSVTGTFDDASHTITWADGSIWTQSIALPPFDDSSQKFEDPNNPNCDRYVIAVDGVGKTFVLGSTSSSGVGNPCLGDGSDDQWITAATVVGLDIEADFGVIGGPAALHGSYNVQMDEITWDDGSVWPKAVSARRRF